MAAVDRQAWSPFKVRFMRAVESRIAAIPDEALRHADDESPEEAAARFTITRSARNPWDVVVGPFLDTEGLIVWLQLRSKRSIYDARRRGDLLAVRAGRRWLFPRFQFSDEGQPLPHLREVLRILHSEMDSAWTQALWLNTPLPTMRNQTPAELLHRGNGDRVLELAQADVNRRAN